MTAFLELLDVDPTGQLGAPAESGGFIDSAQCDTAGLNAGYCVLRDQTDGLLRVPASAADVADLDGLSLYQPLWTPASSSVLYGSGVLVPYLRTGVAWIAGEEAMAFGDPVYVRHTAKGGNTLPGSVRNDADFNAASAAVITVVDSDDGVYSFALSDGGGVPVPFSYTASTKTAAEIGTALQALVDAHPSFVCADTGATLTITSATAANAVTVTELGSPENATPNMTATNGAQAPTAALHTGLRVASPSTAAGRVKIRCNF